MKARLVTFLKEDLHRRCFLRTSQNFLDDVLPKGTTDFECQYPTFLLTKIIENIQIQHLNQCKFDNYQFFPLMTFLGKIIELYL